MAAPTGTPGSAPPRSPTSWTREAPWLPRAAAWSAMPAPQATASTVVASSRALVSSSRLTGRGRPSATSATTQMVLSVIPVVSLDQLELGEEVDDPLVPLAVVFQDLARLPGLRRHDRRDLL